MKKKILYFLLFGLVCAPINAQEKTIKIGNTEWATCNSGAETQSDYGSFFRLDGKKLKKFVLKDGDSLQKKNLLIRLPSISTLLLMEVLQLWVITNMLSHANLRFVVLNRNKPGNRNMRILYI